MIDDSHIYSCEDGSADIEGIEHEEEDEIWEVGQLEAHHSCWSFLRKNLSYGSALRTDPKWCGVEGKGSMYGILLKSLHEASENMTFCNGKGDAILAIDAWVVLFTHIANILS